MQTQAIAYIRRAMPKIWERAMPKTYERDSVLKTMNANPGNSLHRKGNAGIMTISLKKKPR